MPNTERPTDWPLKGIRILDLSSEIAGPYCTKLFVDAGAEVIKVERSNAPDPLRRWSASGAALSENEDGALFQFLNASKRRIEVDPENEEGRLLLHRLLSQSDLLVAAGEPEGLECWGLSWSSLHDQYPKLCVASISPWGLEGPYANRPATEMTLQAAVGSIDYRGLPGRKPVFAGGRVGEWAAGSFAAVGAMSAILAARESGLGQHLDVSMFEAMVLSLTVYHDLNSQWFEGPLPRAIEIPSNEPTQNGWVGLCTITGQQWTDFCALLGRQDIGEDERYLDGRARMEHFEKMRDMIHEWTQSHTTEEVIELAGLMRIPAAPLGNGQTLPEMDQMKARGVFRPQRDGTLHPRPPYRLSQSPLRPLGETHRPDSDRDEILAELAQLEREKTSPPTPSSESALERPLKGLRVIDLTCFWAGPVSTSYLASMGADVIKVESVQRPDGMRFAGAVRNAELWEWSPVFHGANPGKRGITLRLDDEEGKDLLLRLIDQADVVIENFSARVLENFGLDWNTLHNRNDRLILVRMPAFGLDGPWRDRAGFAMTVEQVSGLAWLTGYDDLPLVLRGYCDPVGGMHAVFALLAALEERRRSGQGQLVEVPLVEVAINVAAEQVIEYSKNHVLLSRNENRGPVAAPQGVYKTGEGEELIALATPDEKSWQALCQVIGASDFTDRSEFADPEGRRRQHDAIDERIEQWTGTRAVEEILSELVGAGVPAAHLINAHNLSPHPQLEARQFFQNLSHPKAGETRYPGWPMSFSAWPRALHIRPPPTLGQHNMEILGELGLTQGQVEDLEQRQIIGRRPSFM
ncbi:CoA transferase [Myxococcota bacterium]|nr:CoA transferase [Myxococcota bacterium]